MLLVRIVITLRSVLPSCYQFDGLSVRTTYFLPHYVSYGEDEIFPYPTLEMKHGEHWWQFRLRPYPQILILNHAAIDRCRAFEDRYRLNELVLRCAWRAIASPVVSLGGGWPQKTSQWACRSFSRSFRSASKLDTLNVTWNTKDSHSVAFWRVITLNRRLLNDILLPTM